MRRSDYLIKRALFAIVTVFVAITINFFLFRVLPGSAVRNLSRVPARHARSCSSRSRRSSAWTSRSWQQYLIYVQQLFHGNLGSRSQPAAGV